MMPAIPSRSNGWSSTLSTRIRLSSLMSVLCLIAVQAWALDPSLEIKQYAHTAWTLREGRLKGYPKSMAQTADGSLWLGNEFGLMRFDGVDVRPWVPPPGSSLPGTSVVKLLAARDGSLWIGTDQ